MQDAVIIDDGISIHAPREGCDFKGASLRALTDEFQSTHPVRGATIQATPHCESY